MVWKKDSRKTSLKILNCKMMRKLSSFHSKNGFKRKRRKISTNRWPRSKCVPNPINPISPMSSSNKTQSKLNLRNSINRIWWTMNYNLRKMGMANLNMPNTRVKLASFYTSFIAKVMGILIISVEWPLGFYHTTNKEYMTRFNRSNKCPSSKKWCWMKIKTLISYCLI